MQALKVLVISMGILIVIGLGLLGFGVYHNMQGGSHAKPKAVVAAGAAPAAVAVPIPVDVPMPEKAAGGYFTVDLPMIDGESLQQMSQVGDRLAFRFANGMEQRVVLIDPHNGRIAGVVTLAPQARR